MTIESEVVHTHQSGSSEARLRSRISTEEIVRSYHDEKLSVNATAEKLGINRKTVVRRLKFAGVSLRNLRESALLREPPQRHLDVIGKRYERLLVLADAGTKNGKSLVRCQCDCGEVIVCRVASLINKHTTSCGCLRRERRGFQPNFKHGACCNDHITPEYLAWRSMVQRTTNPHFIGWSDYGGKGVRACKGWYDEQKKGYGNFLADVGEKPEPKADYSLGRFLDTGGYTCGHCPDCIEHGWLRNAEWQSRFEQGAERSGRIAMEAWHERRAIEHSILRRWRKKFGSPTKGDQRCGTQLRRSHFSCSLSPAAD